VRVQNPKLQRFASAARGAILEPGDAELQVPAILQPTIELSSPIDKVLTTIGTLASPAQDSFFASNVIQQTGAVVGFSNNIAFLDRGGWSIDLSFSAAFTGTTNVSKIVSLDIADPDSVGANIVVLPFFTGAFLTWSHTLRFVFQRDGWLLRLSVSTTVAGDNVSAQCSINARKSV
jgi:hypothetical protein